MLISKASLIGIVNFIIFQIIIDRGAKMLEPDTTTSEVIIMYVGIFAFLFGLAFILLKKNS
jgi:uncharacterized membrane protein YczE